MSEPPETLEDCGEGSATADLTLSGMHCAACASLIGEILLEQPGVLDARVDLDSSVARVTYQTSRVDFTQLAAVIADVGYQVTAIN